VLAQVRAAVDDAVADGVRVDTGEITEFFGAVLEGA
jgi:hypothetical protein